MTDTKEIDRLLEKIHHQRQRLGRDEAAEHVIVEPGSTTATGSFAASHSRGSRRQTSVLGSIGKTVADHPALAIGVGAALMVAGPRRSLRLARQAFRGAVFVLGVYRGASSVLGMLPQTRVPDLGRSRPVAPPRA